MAGRSRAAQRKQNDLEEDRSWMKYRECELCGRHFCVNNYEDHKIRLRRFMGYIICAWCTAHTIPAVRKMIKDKKLKVRKK